MAAKTIQVFEWDRLDIDERGFTKEHFDALAAYNDRHEGRYFTLLRGGVRFANYVGVIHVGNLTIEILPKADRDAEGTAPDTWQRVLLNMLHECRWMQVDANEDAPLRLRHRSILDAYLDIFLRACERLLHEGLVRKYRAQEENATALKGKLLFAQNIRQNAVHAERFFVRHTVYDRDNPFNRILRQAIAIVPALTSSPLLADSAGRLLLDWPELPGIVPSTALFDRITFDRKTERYRSAISIARMLLLNYRPDINSGRAQVLAILFDMNVLWEEFAFRRVRAALVEDRYEGWTANRQESQDFWQSAGASWSKTVRPDMVLQHAASKQTIVVDTKWKMPDASGPTDADLKQMLVYNLYWRCSNSYLLYPKVTGGNTTGAYHAFADEHGLYHSSCGSVSVEVLKDGLLNEKTGEEILKTLGIEGQAASD